MATHRNPPSQTSRPRSPKIVIFPEPDPKLLQELVERYGPELVDCPDRAFHLDMLEKLLEQDRREQELQALENISQTLAAQIPHRERLKKIDEELAELDPLPDTSNIKRANYASDRHYKAALRARTNVICAFLPDISCALAIALPPFTFLPALKEMAEWLAPRYVEVQAIGPREVEAFWIRFNRVIDLWKGVPYEDELGQRRPVEERREDLAMHLMDFVENSDPEALVLEQDRRMRSWRDDLDIDQHARLVLQSVYRVNQPAWKQKYYRDKRQCKQALLLSMLMLCPCLTTYLLPHPRLHVRAS
ncbi:hypothetical protein EST38_g13518 [Candolleomyces aberdarensis]|uniref:Uncharacterized protein n=1 Tax=Candolleomyces aberdarensis TaxID=2316362 RepID=A0A4Q2D1K0_9AGAR|nr:hypothetical protein EST38_g13518 [Candolleomyces aberdarensis]